MTWRIPDERSDRQDVETFDSPQGELSMRDRAIKNEVTGRETSEGLNLQVCCVRRTAFRPIRTQRMLKNYLKIALRNIIRNKVHSFISIAGLSMGIAACVLIALYVANEESYDTFNKNADRIVRATMIYTVNGAKTETAYTGTKLLPAFERNFPEVESGVRLYDTRATVQYGERIFDEKHFVYADSTFFSVFSFKMIRGNPADALVRPFSVVLSQSAVRKYFGNENPVGRQIRVNSDHNYTVTGVVRDCPENSQIRFDFLASFNSLAVARPQDQQWRSANYFTYLLLRTPKSLGPLREKIPAYMKTQKSELGMTGNDYMTFHLQPLLRVHLYPRVQGGFEPPGDYRYVFLFSIIGLLILGIACANYINLTTAKASERAKEVGVRKTIGAFRRQLAHQFMGESLVTVLISLAFGLATAELLLPEFNFLSGKTLQFSVTQLPALAGVSGALVLFLGLLGGGYPALVLSRLQPAKVLKGRFTTGGPGLALRKVLIVSQFVISAALIIFTLIIHSQMSYILGRNLGFNKNDVAVLPVNSDMSGKVGTLKNELMSDPDIRSVTVASRTPVFINSANQMTYHGRKIMTNQIGIDPDFLKTLDVQLLAGSNISSEDTAAYMSDDPGTVMNIILNETAVKKLGMNPADAVGKMVDFGIAGRKCRIIGVVRDFYFSSMRELINPLVLFPGGFIHEMMVRISGKNLSQTVGYMKEKWDRVFPEKPFELTFLSEDFNRLYSSEKKTEEAFYLFSILGIALACLGLFGLSAYSIQRRTKEIGIRKTLGAGVIDIVRLLSVDYVRLLVLSNLIAIPLAWYAGRKWLDGFAYRTSISPLIFAISVAATCALVLLTVGVIAVRAAVADPVDSLRYE